MMVFYFYSVLKFKAPPDAVFFTRSAHPNEGETGWLKRCTYIREATDRNVIIHGMPFKWGEQCIHWSERLYFRITCKKAITGYPKGSRMNGKQYR